MLSGTFWEVVRRYKEFDALRSFIELQSPGADLAPFPGKSIWRVRGSSLDKRTRGLEQYIDSVLQSHCLNDPNILVALSSFLEVLAQIKTYVLSIKNSLRVFSFDVIFFRYQSICQKPAGKLAEPSSPKLLPLCSLQNRYQTVLSLRHSQVHLSGICKDRKSRRSLSHRMLYFRNWLLAFL